MNRIFREPFMLWSHWGSKGKGGLGGEMRVDSGSDSGVYLSWQKLSCSEKVPKVFRQRSCEIIFVSQKEHRITLWWWSWEKSSVLVQGERERERASLQLAGEPVGEAKLFGKIAVSQHVSYMSLSFQLVLRF